MSITGNLRTMALPDLLQWASNGRKTGTLAIDNGTITKRIFFREGTIISSASSDPKEYLGHFLVSRGLIDELTLSKALEMQDESRTMLGKILTSIGALSAERLEEMLRLKAEESIYDVFTWAEGEFRFLEDDLPQYSMVPIELDVTSVVLNGTQRMDEWGQIRQRITSVRSVPVSVKPLVAADGDAVGARILALVDDDRTIEEIILQSHASEFTVCKLLYEQIVLGRLKIVRLRGGGIGPNGNDVDATSLIDAARLHLEQEQYERALRHGRAARDLEPENAAVRRAVEDIEKAIQQAVAESGVSPDSIPRLNVDLDELIDVKITAQEGFILSRINGEYDLKTIVKISPMSSLEAEVVVWKLLRYGHVVLSKPDA